MQEIVVGRPFHKPVESLGAMSIASWLATSVGEGRAAGEFSGLSIGPMAPRLVPNSDTVVGSHGTATGFSSFAVARLARTAGAGRVSFGIPFESRNLVVAAGSSCRLSRARCGPGRPVVLTVRRGESPHLRFAYREDVEF